MSDNAGGAALGGLIVIGIVVYVVAMLVAITAVVAMIVLGLLSVWVSRSGGRALVPQEDLLLALFSSACWAGALAVGCMLGSFGLLVALNFGFGDAFDQQLTDHYQFGPNGGPTLLFLYDWIIKDSYVFALNLALVLFVGNRVHVARKHGGWAWLSVIPPIFAMAVMFFAEHGDTIIRFALYLQQSDLEQIKAALIAEFVHPFQMLAMAFSDPDATLAWARASVMQTDGSFFKLATYLPWIFLLVTAAFAMRSLFQGDAEFGSS